MPQYTLSRHVEVLIATAATIIVVDGQDAVDQVRKYAQQYQLSTIATWLIDFNLHSALARSIHKNGSLS